MWRYDAGRPIGEPGGFGTVYEGSSTEGAKLAVKKLRITADEAYHRELDVARDLIGRDFEHVLPILDAGQDADSHHYYIVMPRADRDLQNEIDTSSGLDASAGAEILLQIVAGLQELPHLIHRDLKPGNILLHEGKWKVADFGLARFVERATSLRTVMRHLTPEYAAPEQWREEATSVATDVYALGCIGCALLTGLPPFAGPNREDYRDQHLHVAPPDLSSVDSRLAS